MRSIARLLFGPDADKIADLLGPTDHEREMADRARQAGDWCQTTPGRRPRSRPRPSQPAFGPHRGRG